MQLKIKRQNLTRVTGLPLSHAYSFFFPVVLRGLSLECVKVNSLFRHIVPILHATFAFIDYCAVLVSVFNFTSFPALCALQYTSGSLIIAASCVANNNGHAKAPQYHVIRTLPILL